MKRDIVGPIRTIALCAGLVAGACGFAHASSDAAEGMVREAIDVEVAAQKDNERWQARRAAMVDEIRRLESENLWFSFQERKYERQVGELKGRLEELERTREELDTIERGLEPYLYDLVDGFAAFVRDDLPFLGEERTRRVDFLQATLDDHELSLGEKLRRIFEALEVESAYGRSAEVSTESVSLDGRPAHVTVVRAGRLGLYCLTPDGESAGRYDAAKGGFVTLPDGYARSVAHLRDMIGTGRFTELVALPLQEVR
ncbi:hypothetical protein GGQ74_000316 [Desulfobaculum xiamenense]|uniref:DUF3450 domain-containing protein n=1 Tax=Desulfobaculum xiamenense TaxID=995050 RepID=A0A846QD74_9BACT|nr:DUF3450 domain-containing protein [Desulfobaculum xiamenense]NJB66676.1 hypothetical protein [Desulfobaculum xiamenense]